MHIISETTLKQFAVQHPDAREPLVVWAKVMRAARYTGPADVRQTFATASFLPNDVTVFNIGGNKYRLSVNIRYTVGRVYVRHVMTHAEYDRRSRDGTL